MGTLQLDLWQTRHTLRNWNESLAKLTEAHWKIRAVLAPICRSQYSLAWFAMHLWHRWRERHSLHRPWDSIWSTYRLCQTSSRHLQWLSTLRVHYLSTSAISHQRNRSTAAILSMLDNDSDFCSAKIRPIRPRWPMCARPAIRSHCAMAGQCFDPKLQ